MVWKLMSKIFIGIFSVSGVLLIYAVLVASTQGEMFDIRYIINNISNSDYMLFDYSSLFSKIHSFNSLNIDNFNIERWGISAKNDILNVLRIYLNMFITMWNISVYLIKFVAILLLLVGYVLNVLIVLMTTMFIPLQSTNSEMGVLLCVN